MDESGDSHFKSPIPTTVSAPKVSPIANSAANTPGGNCESRTPISCAKAKREKVEFPEDSMKDLIRLVHANINNKLFMVKEFIAFLAKKNPQDENKGGLDKGTNKSADKDSSFSEAETTVGTPKSSIVEPRLNCSNYSF